MHDYLFSSEIVRFAFVFGIVTSMLLYERLHLTTGSIVVPGYIAIFLVYPLVVAATFVNALFSFWLVNSVIRRRFMLYGRTKFTVMAIISISIQALMLKLTPHGRWLWEDEIPLFVGAGYVVPALIAHDMGRQGVVRTCKAVMLAGIIVATPIAIALLVDLPGVNDLAPLEGFGTMSIVSRWVPLAVLLSAMASWAVTTNYGLKSGGFVGAAYIGMFMGDPYQVAAAFIVAFISFIFVRMVLMRWLILFGRRKFSAMLLTSSLISWTLLWTGTRLFSATVTNHLDLASLALTPLFVPGLLANDMDRTSPPKLALGVAMAAGFVVPTTWWVQSLVEGRHLQIGWRAVAMAMFVIVFSRQLLAVALWLPREVLSRLSRRSPNMPLNPILVSSGLPEGALTAATNQAQRDAEEMFTWSFDGLESWMRKNEVLAAEAREWLNGELSAAGVHAATTST
ncbi:MAG: poly-gamma-glutamate biosynthesis protein PgsC/CapC [Ilumatobacteraceae bacterium]